jgi:hypothetical protein
MTRQDDCVKITGIFQMRAIRGHDGAILETYTDKNLVVNLGREAVAKLLGGAATQVLGKIAVGTNGTLPAVADTSITGAFVKSLNGKTYPNPGTVQCSWSLETSEANGMNIHEFGLLLADNTLFARKTRAPIAKDNTFRLEGVWTIIF